MLPQKMLVQKHLRHSLPATCQKLGMESHHGNLLQNYGIVHRIEGVRPPGKRPVVLHQHRRHMVRIKLPEGLGYNHAGFIFISTLDFL